MRKLRTWREYLIKRLASDRERASGYLQAAFEDCQKYEKPAVFLLALQTVVESQGGISELSKQIDVPVETISEILNSNELPRLEVLSVFLNALECQISIPSAEAAKSGVGIALTESAPIDAEVVAENE